MLISFNEAIRFDAGEFARLLKSLSQQAENKWKWYNETEVLPTILKSNFAYFRSTLYLNSNR